MKASSRKGIMKMQRVRAKNRKIHKNFIIIIIIIIIKYIYIALLLTKCYPSALYNKGRIDI